VMIATFALTILVDLTVAVEVGMVLAAALFLARMSETSEVNLITPDTDPAYQQHSLEGKEIPRGVLVYSIDGPFFFGAAERFQDVLDRIDKDPRVVVFRMRRVPYLDATAINAFSIAVRNLKRRGVDVICSAVQSQPLDMMMRSGFTRLIGDENLQPTIDAALARARVLVETRRSDA
jgi:sulfate permease, SulP family